MKSYILTLAIIIISIFMLFGCGQEEEKESCEEDICAAPIIEETPEKVPEKIEEVIEEPVEFCRNESYACTDETTPCCEGLKEVPFMTSGNVSCEDVGCGTICSPCGNGICDDFEDPCICPEDCVPKCESECKESDAPKCIGPIMLGTCKDHDEDGCFELTADICPNNGTCTDGVCGSSDNTVLVELSTGVPEEVTLKGTAYQITATSMTEEGPTVKIGEESKLLTLDGTTTYSNGLKATIFIYIADFEGDTGEVEFILE